MSRETVGRFAPSPSGRMHLGNVFAALMAWCAVRCENGTMLLRIEDLDPQRCKPEYTQILKDDLLWLELTWDDECPMQSSRGAVYRKQFERLQQLGLVYPCYCSRLELHAASAPHGTDGQVIYAGTCRELTAQQRAEKTRPPAWRLLVPDETIFFTDRLYGQREENLSRDCGDFLIRRADGVTAYQLAVVVDDAQSGVTQVVRGADLLSSTPRQLYLYRLLGFAAPEYFHVPLLVAADGKRLSKRESAMDLGVLRQNHTPQQIIGQLAFAAGLIDQNVPISAKELAAQFRPEKLRPENIEI